MSKMTYRIKRSLFVGLLLGFSSLISPQAPTVSSLPKKGFYLPQRYRFTTVYGFALVNRAPYPIWVTLTNNNQTSLLDFLIESSSTSDLKGVMAKVILDKPTTLTIFDEKKGFQSYQFPLGKTLYVVFDKQGELRPQVGQMYGLNPESKEGFVLTSNLQPGDIKHIK